VEGQAAGSPDLAGWRRERMPEMPLVPAFTLAPGWVCEVLSPSTEALDRGEKMESYAREGVGHLWRVSPLRPAGPVAASGAGARRAL
jgi:Uma2 family endonuclease